MTAIMNERTSRSTMDDYPCSDIKIEDTTTTTTTMMNTTAADRSSTRRHRRSSSSTSSTSLCFSDVDVAAEDDNNDNNNNNGSCAPSSSSLSSTTNILLRHKGDRFRAIFDTMSSPVTGFGSKRSSGSRGSGGSGSNSNSGRRSSNSKRSSTSGGGGGGGISLKTPVSVLRQNCRRFLQKAREEDQDVEEEEEEKQPFHMFRKRRSDGTTTSRPSRSRSSSSIFSNSSVSSSSSSASSAACSKAQSIVKLQDTIRGFLDRVPKPRPVVVGATKGGRGETATTSTPPRRHPSAMVTLATTTTSLLLAPRRPTRRVSDLTIQEILGVGSNSNDVSTACSSITMSSCFDISTATISGFFDPSTSFYPPSTPSKSRNTSMDMLKSSSTSSSSIDHHNLVASSPVRRNNNGSNHESMKSFDIQLEEEMGNVHISEELTTLTNPTHQQPDAAASVSSYDERREKIIPSLDTTTVAVVEGRRTPTPASDLTSSNNDIPMRMPRRKNSFKKLYSI